MVSTSSPVASTNVKNKIFKPFMLEILLKGRKILKERKAYKLIVP